MHKGAANSRALPSTDAECNSFRNEALPISAIPLFAGLNSSEIADVFAHGRTLSVSPKTQLCTAGEKAEHFFVLLHGRLKFCRTTVEGDEILLALLTPGASFGLSALLPDPLGYLGTAEAAVASKVAVWNHSQIRRLASSFPQIPTNALSIALQFLEKLAARHSSLFEGDASIRIARALIGVGHRTGQVHPEGVDVQITNEQLGSLADVSRFTASCVLSKWHKAGVITKKREAVRIHSPDGLLSD